MTTTDPTTGLPEAPEGHFWEIKHAALDGAYRLELRKQLWWKFSDRVEYTIILPPYGPSYLIEKALYVLEKYNGRFQYTSDWEAAKIYVGKYPPKNIKDIK